MKRYYRFLLIWMMGAGGVVTLQAQQDTGFARQPLSLRQYLGQVGRQNLNLVAQQYNVDIAGAGIEAAKIFPDPQLSAGVYNNQNPSKQLGYGYNATIGTNVELGGKRTARIGLAREQLQLNRALLEDYLRNLRADAASAYYNALLAYQLYLVRQSAYFTMKQLAAADSIRFKLGTITETDARQSKLEAGTLQNSLYQDEADWKTALLQLGLFAGKQQADTLLQPTGGFDSLERNFILDSLIPRAQESRADVVAAAGTKKVAEKNLQLVKANRKPDIGLSLGAAYSAEAKNSIAPTPAYHSVNAGVAIPLKFSNRYKGDVHAAQFAITQAALQYQQVLLQIQTEVTQAWFNYQAAQQQVTRFKSGLLEEAKKVLNAKTYSYQRGATSLLEVLSAQRTYSEIQQNYYQALYAYAAALITLERACGIWDLQ